VRRVVAEHADSKTLFYALEGDDTGEITPTWLGAMVPPDPVSGAQPFDLYAGGSFCGRFALQVPGAHNVRNAVGAIATCAEGFGVGVQTARNALMTFEGVRRRQDLLGRPDSVAVYDDFAHHPTAVDETLRALRARHPNGKLWAVFEPRSATACRALHQHEYVSAFASVDLSRLAQEIGGGKAVAETSVDAILERIVREAEPGDTVALLSNGAFGGIHARLLAALAARRQT
jgi:UDP-N-acetylmuramate: L-alanyl-gamma-D-glutamyl-meso-diaminopimelate ligase